MGRWVTSATLGRVGDHRRAGVGLGGKSTRFRVSYRAAVGGIARATGLRQEAGVDGQNVAERHKRGGAGAQLLGAVGGRKGGEGLRATAPISTVATREAVGGGAGGG